MYPLPLVNYGVNYQPIRNLPQTNGILRNQNGLYQKYPGENRISSSSQDNSNIQNGIYSTRTTIKSSRKRPANTFTTRYCKPDRLLSRQSSVETISTQHSIPSYNPLSFGTLQDRIQRERKSHTMAPSAQILGPRSTPQANMFASINAPTDNPARQISQNFHQTSDLETTDDDTSVIAKVRYNPQSEDAVRNTVNNQIKNDPVVVNCFEQNIPPQLPNHFPHPKIPLQPSCTFPSAPHPFLHYKKIHPEQAPKPFINHQKFQFLKLPPLPNRTINSPWINRSNPTGINSIKSMAAQQSPTTFNNQQTLLRRPNTGPSSNEVFRPPSVKDIPELSQENLLNMLNQIPDLQGRRFNIEYAPPNAPEGYPIPTNLDPNNSTYPEPVVIDKLPTNIIQHVKNSNNPALTAALEATIQQEQHHFQSQPTVMHHPAQPYRQVQQSRSASSDDSDSSTEVSSSSEEFKEISGNNNPFIGPIPPRSNQNR